MEHPYILEKKSASHVRQAILFEADGEAVGISKHLLDDLGDGNFAITFFELFDEVGVLSESTGIEEKGNPIPIGYFSGLLYVLERNRLTCCRVVRDCQIDEGYSVASFFLYKLTETLNIHVSLEGILLPDFLHGEIAENVLREKFDGMYIVAMDVCLRGVEVTVARYSKLLVGLMFPKHLSDGREQEVFCTPALGYYESVGSN